MKSKILVTGKNGQLGTELIKANKNNNHEYLFIDKDDLDLSNISGIIPFLESIKPDIIINCAAYTAVDKAETDVEVANITNAFAPIEMAKYVENNKKHLIQISTDYVFDGNSFLPYKETDYTSPLGVYGSSKLLGENGIAAHTKNYSIIRTSWLYSNHGLNFLNTMKRLGKEKESIGVVYDQIGTPTFAGDLANVILKFVESDYKNLSKIYHFSDEGVTSWYDFAILIMSKLNLKCKINPIETIQYPTPAKRPNYSVLNKNKIKNDLKIEISHWLKSLETCLNEL